MISDFPANSAFSNSCTENCYCLDSVWILWIFTRNIKLSVFVPSVNSWWVNGERSFIAQDALNFWTATKWSSSECWHDKVVASEPLWGLSWHLDFALSHLLCSHSDYINIIPSFFLGGEKTLKLFGHEYDKPDEGRILQLMYEKQKVTSINSLHSEHRCASSEERLWITIYTITLEQNKSNQKINKNSA